MVVLVAVAPASARASEDSTAATPEPRRPDLVATFSSGFVSFTANGNSGSTTLKSGLISLSSDNPFCVASPSTPCHYTINQIELTANDTSVGGQDVKNVHAVNMNVAVGAVDDGSGMRLTVPPGMTFNVSGEVGGQVTAFAVNPTSPNILSMAIDPVSQQITLYGTLQGTQSGLTLSLSILATTDAPFTNVPPIANAGPDQQLSTSCFALATLDKSGTSDPDGDLAYSYFTENGASIGDGTSPVALLPSQHQLTLNAFDAVGARGTDGVTITVVDDGGTQAVPGATLFQIQTPPGVAAEDVSILGEHSLSMSPMAVVTGGDAIDLGTPTTLSPNADVQGDVWSVGAVSLGSHSEITGTLHTAAPVTTKPGATVGGLDTNPSFTPPTIISWNAVIPPNDGAAIGLGPSQASTIAPGNYGAITLGPNAALTLSSGTYTATSLSTQPNSTITVDDTDGPVFLYLRGPLAHKGTLTSVSGGTPQLLLVATSADVSGVWAGTLLVTGGDVNIGPPPNNQHRGAVFATSGSVAVSGNLTHDSFPWQVLRSSRSSCALTPISACVEELGPDSFVAHFDYRNAVTFSGIYVPIGAENRFTPSPEFRGQPNRFLPGLSANQGFGAFEIPFDGTPLTWVLGGLSVTASSASPRCP